MAGNYIWFVASVQVAEINRRILQAKLKQATGLTWPMSQLAEKGGGMRMQLSVALALTKTTVLVARAVVPEETFLYTSKDLDLGNGVRSEVHDVNGPRMLDWQEYGDRVLFAALNAQNASNQNRVDELMTIARGMSEGKGLRDKVYRVDGYLIYLCTMCLIGRSRRSSNAQG